MTKQAQENATPSVQRRQLSSSDRGPLRNWFDLVKTAGGRIPYGVGFLILLLVVIGLVFFGGDDASAPSNEGAETTTELDQDSQATTEPHSGEVASAVAEFVDADGATPLSGTWVMYWRNSEDTDSPAFTLRFNGVDGGTVEVLNDETEFDTWIEFDGDVLRFGFTRMMERVDWPEKSDFTGTHISDGQFLGNWFRDVWECDPNRTPPCVTEPDQVSYTAWIERQP
jgi:hypothetical protein